MRAVSALVGLVSLASVVSASDLFSRQIPNLPSCAIPCLATTQTFGNCSSTDQKCLCGNSDFIQTTAACVEKSCSGSDVQSALSAAQSLCAASGVSLDASSILASATASGASSASGSASASGSTTASGSSASATSPSTSGSASASASATGAANNGALANNVNVLSGILGAGVAAFVAL